MKTKTIYVLSVTFDGVRYDPVAATTDRAEAMKWNEKRGCMMWPVELFGAVPEKIHECAEAMRREDYG